MERMFDFRPLMEKLSDTEKNCLPIRFESDLDLRRTNLIASVWEAVGFEVKIKKTRSGFILVLNLPEAG